MATFTGNLLIKWFREKVFCTSQPVKVLQYENKQTKKNPFASLLLPSSPFPFPSFLPSPSSSCFTSSVCFFLLILQKQKILTTGDNCRRILSFINKRERSINFEFGTYFKLIVINEKYNPNVFPISEAYYIFRSLGQFFLYRLEREESPVSPILNNFRHISDQ